MHRNTSRAMLALPLLFAAAAWKWSGPTLELRPESRLWVAGTSTVRAWQCSATAFQTNVEASQFGAVAGVIAGEKVVTTVDLKVVSDSLDCHNGTMNGHMKKALKAAEFPAIVFRLESYELAKEGDSLRVTMNGDLTLGGVKKPVTLLAIARGGDKGALRVAGTYELKMSDYGLKAPSLMFGTMKVGDKVTVGFDLILKDANE